MVALFGAGFGGLLLALFILTLVFLIFFSPLFVLFLLLRYLKRWHDDRVRLAEQAIATGRPMPDSFSTLGNSSADRQTWNKGVRNAALGCGLMLMFAFWDAYALSGIGALVLCLGVGQMVIARTGGKMVAQEPSQAPDPAPQDGEPGKEEGIKEEEIDG